MWRTASTRVTTRGSQVARVTGRVTAPPRHGPAGDLHAYEPGATTTACGLEAGPLKRWPTLSFRREISRRRCDECMQVVHG